MVCHRGTPFTPSANLCQCTFTSYCFCQAFVIDFPKPQRHGDVFAISIVSFQSEAAYDRGAVRVPSFRHAGDRHGRMDSPRRSVKRLLCTVPLKNAGILRNSPADRADQTIAEWISRALNLRQFAL